MTTFMAVCLGLITLELGFVCLALLVAVFRVKKAAEALESLAYRLEEQVLYFANGMRGGWMKVLQVGATVAGGLWRGRKD